MLVNRNAVRLLLAFSITPFLNGCLAGPSTSPPSNSQDLDGDCDSSEILESTLALRSERSLQPISELTYFDMNEDSVKNKVVQLQYYDDALIGVLNISDYHYELINDAIYALGNTDSALTYVAAAGSKDIGSSHVSGNSGYLQFVIASEYINFITDYCSRLGSQNLLEPDAETLSLSFASIYEENNSPVDSSAMDFAVQENIKICQNNLIWPTVYHQLAHVYLLHIAETDIDSVLENLKIRVTYPFNLILRARKFLLYF